MGGGKNGKVISRKEANRRCGGQENEPSLKFQTPKVLQFLTRAKKQFNEKYEKNPKCDVSLDEDFDVKRTLGSGSFGRVVLAEYKKSKKKKVYAVKIMEKAKVMKQKQLDHTMNEKRILASISFPFIVKQAFAFKDNTYIYIALEFVSGGEMFHHLRNAGRFGEMRTRFYASQVLLAFEYMHYLDLIHRDLKPENLLIDHKGYLKVTDFGFCKKIKGRAWTFCGTPEYLAPEIILSKGYGKAVDWWSFGILMFEMASGQPPFQAEKHIKMYDMIVSGKVEYPKHFSAELKDLLENLIQVDVTKRYGALRNGVQDIKNHKFFAPVDYIATYQKRLEAPFVPETKGVGDDSNFEKQDEEAMKTSETCKFEEEFKDF